VASNHRNELIDRADRQIEDSSTTTISIFEDNLINGNEKVLKNLLFIMIALMQCLRN